MHSSLAQTQHSDSTRIVNQRWKTQKIQKGIVWKQAHFNNLFQAHQEINFLVIDLKRAGHRLHLAAEPTQLKTTSTFAYENKALAAINAGFFDMKNGGAVDYIKVDNTVINLTKSESARANAVFAFSAKEAHILASQDHPPEKSEFPNLLLAGPLLLRNNALEALPDSPFNSNRHPRTALAITADHKLILFVVDGRSPQSYGMSLKELAQTLKWLGATSAMNLDGGGSSSMYIRKANGIVNHPTDNKQFDHLGERPVANILFIK